MKLFGVLGDPVSHSLSPVMHNAAFKALGMDCAYHAFRVRPENLKDAIHGAYALGFGGLNLTIPLKEKALEIVKPSVAAKEIGAVNTVDFKDGIVGYNTDGIGAKKALAESGIEIDGKNVLLLGAGGAARALAFQLARDGASVNIANRTVERAQALASEVNKVGRAKALGLENLRSLIKECDILINSTAVGMFPEVSGTIVSSDMMHSDLVVFDIVYNPVETGLLREARKAGARTIDGVKMLVHQGAEAFRIWTGKIPPVDVMEKAVREKLK
ncbi:MAG: shikimate dehydrogenase [Candidatus Methanoperedens sp.]|nr:shikimate dehydrogenase [Candidatus Methanoperedens sp.]MCZ7361163.1 shikimate dehydrogenase [Candidatus Methanoperedens sp.]HLB72204.1 shikimate dehydrogenase [Candidatus Methanoperedens sp.]